MNGLKKFFPIRSGLLRRVIGQVRAVDDVNFHINHGETLSLVGESGCGKTTTSRCILRAVKPTAGEINFRTGDGQVLELSVANDVGFGDRKSTNWFRCAIWGKRAATLQPMLLKGKQVFVRGELTMRAFTNKDGVEKLSAEVRVDDLQLLGGKEPAQNTDDGADTPF